MTHDIPWTYEARPDSRVSNIRLGIWLFLASETMLFASLFSAYVLLRAGAADWPDARAWLHTPTLVAMTLLLAAATAVAGRAPRVTALAAAAFLLLTGWEWTQLFASGVMPATHVAAGCWFVLTGLHALHVAAGMAAGLWMHEARHGRPAAHVAERRYALTRYWMFVDLVWLAILVSFTR